MREGKRVKDKESGERRRVWSARGKVCVRARGWKRVERMRERERESSEKRGELEKGSVEKRGEGEKVYVGERVWEGEIVWDERMKKVLSLF